MKTITLNVQIIVQKPEYDSEGEPLTEADQLAEFSGIGITVLKNGIDISSTGETEGCDVTVWQLLPEEENFNVAVQFGQY